MPVLVDYDETFLEQSWHWLKDPEIKALTLTPDFTREQQQAFFNSLPSRNDYWIRGVSENDQPIGAMGLKNISTTSAEYWGYIGEKKYWGKGNGSFMMQQAIKKALEMKLESLFLQVHQTNERAKKLYEKMGFHLSVPGEIEKYQMNL